LDFLSKQFDAFIATNKRGWEMKFLSIRQPGKFAFVAFLALAFAMVSLAQYDQPSQQQVPSDKSGASGQGPAAQGAPAQVPPKLNPKEETDYKILATLPESDRSTPDKRIQLGLQFLQKYPGSRYQEAVYNQLVSAYFVKQDWVNFYAYADKAVAMDPDDVDVLTAVGWVIPHLYSKDDADADKKLDKAESYENHAIEVIPSLQKPDNLSSDQFAQAKAGKLAQAHSALGLIYFRMEDFANSVKELQLATQGDASPDPTDLYAMGVGLRQLKRNGEATEAFAKCAAIPGGLQEPCKQSAEAAKSAK
jgi:tetratricopeptide (TPR) repeat protein